jgi:hypothetical protein
MFELHFIFFDYIVKYFNFILGYFNNFNLYIDYLCNFNFSKIKQKLYTHFQSYYSKHLLKSPQSYYDYSIDHFISSFIIISKYIIKKQELPTHSHPIFYLIYILFFIEPLNNQPFSDIVILPPQITLTDSFDKINIDNLIKNINIDYINEFIEL